MEVGDKVRLIEYDQIHPIGSLGRVVGVEFDRMRASRKRIWVRFYGDPENESSYFYPHEIELVTEQRNPDIEIPDGELEGWEIMLKIATNGLGRAAVLFQSNVVAIGPTENNADIAQWLREWLMED